MKLHRSLTSMLAGGVLAATVCAGCSPPSLLFTRIVEPYSANFTDTTVGNKICRVTDHQVRVPVSGQSITALWSMDHIRRALDDAGITRISYVDRETLSFLRGIYRRRELIIYGE